MVSHALNAYEKLGRTFSEWVWYESNAALNEGQAVCYNVDYGTATVADARRFARVETPSTTNAQWFAGVSARDILAKSTPQLIEIYNPGSICNIYVAVSTVLNEGLLTFDVTSGVAGQFLRTGMPGAGSAIPQQTTTYVATAQLCLAQLQVGLPSGGVEYFEPADVATFVAMVGGTTLLKGRSLSQDCVEEIVDGLIEGLKKRFAVVTTAFTSYFLQVDVENNDGVKLDGTALAEVTIDTVGGNCTFEWKQGQWHHLGGFDWNEA